MAARDFLPPTTAPEAPYAAIAWQVVNTTVDRMLINQKLNREGQKPFYEKGVPTAGLSGLGYKSKAKIDEYKLGQQFECKQGDLVFAFRTDKGIVQYSRQRSAKRGKGAAEVCIPVFSTRSVFSRLEPDMDPTEEQLKYEAMIHERSIEFIGISRKPASDQDNDSNFTTVVAGNVTVAGNVPNHIPAGALVAYRLPTPEDIKLIGDREVPDRFHLVAVNRSNWDLAYYPAFKKTAEYHFTMPADGVADDTSKGVRLGIVALAAYNAGAGVDKINDAYKAIAKLAPGLPDYDVAVVQIMLALKGNGDAARLNAADFRDEAAIRVCYVLNVTQLLPALREIINWNDHTIIGRALEPLQAHNGEGLIRLGRHLGRS